MRKDKLTNLMERLDPTYSAYKKASKDQSSTPEERAAASSELSKRESDIRPTYKQIALLYADLHEYVFASYLSLI
jgi:acetyl-CoA carboxylase/biotin carboxylase 1